MVAIALIQAKAGGAPWLQFVPIVVMVLIFYVLVFVPQARQRKVHKAMVDSLSKGDQVVTMGGLVGEVMQVKDDVVMLRTGQAVVAVERARIARRTSGAVKAKQA